VSSWREWPQHAGGLATRLLELARLRLELASLECLDEAQRLVRLLLLVGVILISLTLTLSFAGAAVVVAYWDTSHRFIAALAVVAGFGAFSLGLLALLFYWLHQATPPFPLTRAEFAKDAQRLDQPSTADTHS
jgi:uncharacterized membrane protein YqjE